MKFKPASPYLIYRSLFSDHRFLTSCGVKREAIQYARDEYSYSGKHVLVLDVRTAEIVFEIGRKD